MIYCALCRRAIWPWQRRRARVHKTLVFHDSVTEYTHLLCEFERILDVLDAPEEPLAG